MRINESKLEELMAQVGASKEELARAADLNARTLQRLKGEKVLGSKSTRKILEGIQKLRALGAQAAG
jgi:DNA-binding Xre family transcriptional regulator